MANVTDPLAQAVHGTNPQNLIEYITRQKIYDSLFWKEECFGLTASDVAAKASELKALGGSYGGNNKPTRFLCLALKMLQIQPEEGIIEEFLQNEDFKYVRALGAFYLRLTGRPADIYEQIEPLYNDFRKLRYRESTGWKITYMDELADELLHSNMYCGISLPHLPKRQVLVSAAYLDGPRRSALTPLIDEQAAGNPELFLQKMAENGNIAAKVALEERRNRQALEEKKSQDLVFEESRQPDYGSNSSGNRFNHKTENDFPGKNRDRKDRSERDGDYRFRRERHEKDAYCGAKDHAKDNGDYRRREYDRNDGLPRDEDYGHDGHRYRHSNGDNHTHRSKSETRSDQRHGRCDDEYDKGRKKGHRKSKSSSREEKKYGTLFKKSTPKGRDLTGSRHGTTAESKHGYEITGGKDNGSKTIEGNEDFWNEQRAKLGLKPLRK